MAALRWIKANITAFEGDPSRVTIAGQSATAGSVNAQGLPVWEPYSGNKQVMRLEEDMGMILVTASEERFEFLKKKLLGDQ